MFVCMLLQIQGTERSCVSGGLATIGGGLWNVGANLRVFGGGVAVFVVIVSNCFLKASQYNQSRHSPSCKELSQDTLFFGTADHALCVDINTYAKLNFLNPFLPPRPMQGNSSGPVRAYLQSPTLYASKIRDSLDPSLSHSEVHHHLPKKQKPIAEDA
ncbi:hypothetical protein TNCV_2592131 [Trichonephila clavipes]|nr:hypothetical protein TNCV_2592131 [Trichonephila clavipes]